MEKLGLAFVLLCGTYFSFAQTGPGGVGNADGSNSQPTNVLWLRANSGVSSTGGLVDTWVDQSGNNNSASGVGTTRPTFNAADANFNGLSSITFPNTAGLNYYLEVPNNSNLDGTSALSVFFVVRPTSLTAPNGILSKRSSAGVLSSYVFEVNSSYRYRSALSTEGLVNIVSANSGVNSVDVFSFVMNGTSQNGFFEGANNTPRTSGISTIPTNASNLFVGSYDPASIGNFEGQIAEVVIYNSALNVAQRIIVENYLSSKYNNPLSANDNYVGDVAGGTTLNHDFDLAGIGFSGGTSHLLGNSQGFILSPSGGTVDVNGEFVLTAHNGFANAVSVANLGTGGVVQRWARTWYVDKTGIVDANITFDFSEGIAGQFPQNKDNYVLLRRNTTSGNYDVVTTIANSDKTLVGDQISFRVTDADLTDGVYTLGTLDLTISPVNGVSNRTWYSYQSGDWTVPTSWTLDGGVFPLLVNPSNEIPGATDNVVVTSGRIITMNVNNVQVNSVDVTGTLDLLASTGHNFVTISGGGRIKIAGSTENFPLGTLTSFADATIGGTLEMNGTGIILNQNRTFRNVEINLTNTTDIVSLESNYILNGNLSITNGVFRFNNNATAANRTMTVNGNVSVDATGAIRVGSANARHEFNLHGNFSNNGTAYFTQRSGVVTAAVVNAAEATDGIVDVNFVSPSKDQIASCNGVTRFYRMEINKGTNETYKVTVNASSIANFNLYGTADYNVDNTGIQNNNAVGLMNGTLEVGVNVNIPFLNTTGNYAISETAQLWVNGGLVTKSGGTAIVPYGRLKVTSGTLTAPIGSGITTRESGIIQVEGGIVTVGAIRTSIAGAGAVGSYIQSGGTVTVTGTNGISDDYAVFSLTYTGNVFNMSGGTLIVRNRPSNLGTGSLRGSIFINSDPANVNITGGTVIAEINSTVSYIITSRAPFWNLRIRNTLDGILRDVELIGSTSGTGGGAAEPSVVAQNLVVKGSLTIDAFARLDHNGRNINIGGDLTINLNGDLIFDQVLANGRRNTTTLDGTSSATLAFLNRVGTGAGDEQRFWNLVINKPADKVVSLASGKSSLDNNDNNLLRIDGTSFKLLSGTLDQGFHSIRMFCDTVLNYQTLGVFSGASTDVGAVANDRNDMIKFRDDNSPTTLLTTNSAVFGVVRLNSGDDPIALRSNVFIQFLQYLYGKINLGSYNLKIDQVVGGLTNPAQLPPRGTEADSLGLQTRAFSVEDMLVSGGNASDGGLSLKILGNGDYKFPLGIGFSANDNTNNPGSDIYTPATVTISNFSSAGYITINPVNSVLQTTNLAGGTSILDYYWRVRYEGFTTLPTVKYQFTYNQSDVGGTEANYVPGKVLDVSPFTRSSETAGINATWNTIFFKGAGAGFTLEQANYTAGAASRFTGTPRVFFVAVGSGNWNAASTWSLTRGGAGGAGIPVAGDIVIMRRGGSGGYPRGVVTIPSGYTANSAQVLFDDEQGFISGCPRIIVQTGTPFNSKLGTVEVAPTHQGGVLNGDSHGAVMQYNVDNTYTGIFPSGDFGIFNNYLNALVIYEWQSGTGTITLSSNAVEYPQLWFQQGNASRLIKFPNVPVTVKGRAYITGDNRVMTNDGANSVLLNFQRNLEIGSSCCGGGTFLFPGTAGADQTVQVDGNILFTTGGGRSVSILNPASGTRLHKLIVKGNIDVVASAVLNLGSSLVTETNVLLELQGDGSNTFANAGTATLSRIVMNKGSNITNTFTFNNAFTLTGATNTATKSITLQNGLLILNNAAINITLTSGGGDFNIPSTSGLEVRAGTARTTTTSANANITLDGLLRVSGGTVDINGGGATDTNFIEYSNSGNAAIEVTGGSLTVAGKIRRALTSSTGVLRYTQSAGTVLIANESGTGSDDRGVFEVANTGSQFNHSGGSLTIVQGINSTTVPSILIDPATSSITSGSTITIGNGSTPSGATTRNIGILSTAALYNLTIAGSNNPVVKIYTSPLTVGNNLLVSSNTALNANSQNLTIGGNFTVDGSYVPTTNTTTFTNTAAAAISGATPLFNFYNFTKIGGGTLSISKDITVNQDVRVLAGILSTTSFAVNLKRHATIDATISSTSGLGLIFSGAVQQQLLRTTGGTSTLGIVTIKNALGVVIPDVTGYNFDITSNLRLEQGVFDIGGSLLFLRINAIVSPINPFSVTNMIQTNSSFTDKGVKKQFPLNYTTDFIFPVGQLAYTPVAFNFSSAGNTSGGGGIPTVTVRPANEIHPAVVNDDEAGELPDPISFNDLNNVLQYHWIVNADNVASTFRSAMTLSYPQSVVSVTAPYTEADYIAARILTDANPTKLINKFTTTEVNEVTNVITFDFIGVTDAGISAEYFAGVDIAIPNNVPVYTTISSGNVNSAIYTPAVPGGGAPRGATVIVSTGHSLTFNINDINLYETQISAGATLIIPSGSIGHRLGTLTGTGDLRINSNTTSAILPAAVYDEFFSCSGGGLIYGGSGNYEILGGVTALRQLTLEDGGGKTLANNDINVCNDFVINGGRFTNSNSREITVQNDFLINSTIGVTIDGNLFITRDFTYSSGGYFIGGNSGSKIIGRNLTINGGNFISGGGSNTIRINGNMDVAGAATFTGGFSSTTGLKYIFQGSAPQTITGDFTGTRFINRLEINNNNGLTLVGNVDIDKELILTTGNITTGSNTFTMSNSAVATPSVGRSTSFVNGRLYKVFAAAGNSFSFPIGAVGATPYWRSGAVKNVSAAGTWDMQFVAENAQSFESAVVNMTPVAPIQRISTGGYWVVSDGTLTASGKTATIGLSWGIESDVSAVVSDREKLQVVQWEPGTSQWSNKGATNFSAGHTQSRGTFDAGSTTSFSRRIVTLGSTVIANPLPVSFLGFTGKIENGINVLRWTTASERNNDYFELERSTDNAETFEVIGKREGSGTSKSFLSYAFEDYEAQVGKNYYRLKQVDFDGTISYHPELVLLTVESGGDFLDFTVFPNPTKDQLFNLKIFRNNNEAVQIRLYDVNGKVCFTHSDTIETLQLQTNHFSPGVYIIEVTQGFRRVTKRVVIKD